ncbi:MAG: homoserine dehydrogenase [Oscillospiraceae bacterium]|nr:homoserine dehydrogenase [Oscillospiraceae bacterium]
MISVAILGYGTVGSGVADVISANAEKISQSAAQDIKIKYILDLRDFPDSPYKDCFTKDFSVIENDPEVKIVVETIGGTGVAYEYTRRALLAGKSVVTSNKELVATHGCELLKIARENNLNYLFEASVGGGIPIIRPLSQCLAANRIDEIYGILNGTTNYILSRMINDGASFDEALAQAQANGYAERDPSADIDGPDACRKICILASLAFGCHFYPDGVPTEGIRSVTLEDVSFAASTGCKVKLIARAVRDAESGKFTCYVAPHLIPSENLLSNVEGVFNGIVVKGNAIGNVMFYGRGAGKLPTASAVAADVIDAAKHVDARKYFGWGEAKPEMLFDPLSLVSRWYVRGELSEAEAKALFGDVKIIQAAGGSCVFTTPAVSGKDAKRLLSGKNIASLYRILE